MGPCLFLININELPDTLAARTSLFVDDKVAYKVVASPKDQPQLQQDLGQIAEWGKRWDIVFWSDKCTSLRVTRSERPPKYQY